jgi:hypothetical protein
MSEAELMQSLLGSIQVILSLFSVFFTIVSAYIAGLFFFLHRAPMALRLLAFLLLSVGLIFLGTTAATQQRVQEGLFASWSKLPSPSIDVQALRNPLMLPVTLPPGTSLQDIGIVIGWGTAVSVYLALAYLTFIYRWRRGNGAVHA